jgi:hypothetical protein
MKPIPTDCERQAAAAVAAATTAVVAEEDAQDGIKNAVR